MKTDSIKRNIELPISITIPQDHYKNKLLLQSLLTKMLLSRKFEQKVQQLFSNGLVHGTAHLGIGEEGAGIGTTHALKEKDFMLTTHRGHVQTIGKGCDINLMMAEILGKETGLCRGRGGSMHIADFNKGILGANGIVGANAPLACGAALSCKKLYKDRICLAFTGDGSTNEGAVMEALNLASIWRLPVVFAVINNTYGMSTHISRATRDTDLTKRAIPFAMRCYEVDGNDVLAVYETVRQARLYAIDNGPVLIIENTYRVSGHSKSDKNLYRSTEEINYWKENCPIKRFKEILQAKNILTMDEINKIENETTMQIEKAEDYAKKSPNPNPKTTLENVYAV